MGDAGAAEIDAGPACVDTDRDGVGAGPGCVVSDCDNLDPWTVDECGTECDEHPQRRGCRCSQPGGGWTCYTGPADTQDVGACEHGQQRCTEDGWESCEDQTWPVAETCDGRDEDCDGVVDNGVTNECGGCGTCRESCAGQGCDAAFVSGDDVEIAAGGVQVVPWPFESHVLWIPDEPESIVSRIDTTARRVVARYRTAGTERPDPGDVAVGLAGDVVVLNRRDQSVTRILAEDCPDRDGDGVVETSGGEEDTLAWDETGPSDECIAWNQPLAEAVAHVARRITPGLDGSQTESIWVSLDDGLRELSLDDGALGGEAEHLGAITAIAPGPGGVLWVADMSQTITSIDPSGETASFPFFMDLAGGLALDWHGRVWIGGPGLERLDPVSELWERVAGLGDAWAYGIAIDARDDAYSCFPQGFRVDGDALEPTALEDAAGTSWALASDGMIWALGTGTHIVDPADDSVQRIPWMPIVISGLSDPTGAALWRATRPVGRVRQTFVVCEPAESGTLDQLFYEAEIPVGSWIDLRVAGVDAGDAPADSSPIALGAAMRQAGAWQVSGDVLVEADLHATGSDPVVLRRLGLRFSCARE